MSAAGTVYTVKGRRWMDARTACSNFTACLPPNSPSCSSSNDSGQGYGAYYMSSASSNHSGGVNVVMLDGSVRFVSETIDCGDLNNCLGGANNADGMDYCWQGKSTRGVWGAMATPKGKETVSM